jgi:tetratricopeptide (TPR) repeat protein
MDYGEQARTLWLTSSYNEAIALTLVANHNVEVWFYAGKSYKDLKNDNLAIDCWRMALTIEPDHESTLRAIAWLAHEIENYRTEVINSLLKLARLNKANGDDLTLLGEMYLKENRFEESHHWLKEGLEKGTRNESLTYLDLATLHTKLAIQYLQICENCADLDLEDPMSEEDKTEAVLRFIYQYMTAKVKHEPEKPN